MGNLKEIEKVRMQSLGLLRPARQTGYKRVITTPRYMDYKETSYIEQTLLV